MIVDRSVSVFDAARNGSARISRCRSGTPGRNWRIANRPAIGRHPAAVRRVPDPEPRMFPTNSDLVPSASTSNRNLGLFRIPDPTGTTLGPSLLFQGVGRSICMT
ncbi:hypothetical protein BGZ61DRAFT_467212 [Ilyonectria robusta]|uniref:uncharacterized protein n=1 Tax=Ilyonectria robusta TaxID=1079257 RepID=UPI001E8D652A|nr:uncharacterized protein BGZ61DRAFT_467212 [Ilyonectria robusta]KAH8654850.1 hypothetical protein BGZ61DRAFT_467212 [Ilyonectria robusta]